MESFPGLNHYHRQAGKKVALNVTQESCEQEEGARVAQCFASLTTPLGLPLPAAPSMAHQRERAAACKSAYLHHLSFCYRQPT